MLMNFSPSLQAKRITCHRNQRVLFKDINIDLGEGDCLQVIGSNGVGKTSLLRILAGLLSFYSGDVFWRGIPINKNKPEYYRSLCYLGHQQGIKLELTVEENLRFNLRKMKNSGDQINQLLSNLQLTEYHSSMCYQLSQGQRQKVALARILLSDAPIWILDEPFATLDAKSMEKMQYYFLQKLKQGGMIILSTHRLLTLENLPQRTLLLSPIDPLSGDQQ